MAENIIRLEQKSGVQHWFLMVHVEDEADVLRAELSYPETFKQGFFKAFRKRIILIGGDSDNDDGVKARRDEPDGDLDIAVTRKQG